MRRNNVRHIVTGLEAKFDVNAVTPWDVWIDGDEVAEALRQIRKLTGDENFKPNVYPSNDGDRVCIRL